MAGPTDVIDLANKLGPRDLTLISIIEGLRSSGKGSPVLIAKAIKGATPAKVILELDKLVKLGALRLINIGDYAVTQAGVLALQLYDPEYVPALPEVLRRQREHDLG